MKYNQNYGSTNVSAIRIADNIVATVVPLKKEYFQGGLVTKTLNAPSGFSVYVVDKNGQLSNDLAGASISLSFIQQYLARNANLLLVRTSPIKLSVQIDHNGKFDPGLGVRDSYKLYADVFGYVSQPIVFTSGMNGLHLNSSVNIDAVSATFTDALKLAVTKQGQKILFKNNATVHNAVMDISNTMGIQCMNFIIHGFESALNNQQEADVQHGRDLARKTEDMMFRLIADHASQVTNISKTALEANATPQALNAAIKQTERAYMKTLDQLQQVSQNYQAIIGLSAGERPNAPRLQGGRSYNHHPKQLNAGRASGYNHGKQGAYSSNRGYTNSNGYHSNARYDRPALVSEATYPEYPERKNMSSHQYYGHGQGSTHINGEQHGYTQAATRQTNSAGEHADGSVHFTSLSHFGK